MSKSENPPVGEKPEEPEWRKRKRLAEVFGEVVPDTTSDERDGAAAGGGKDRESASDRWLKSQVPPHHHG